MEEQRARWARELTLIDVADAFPHLPVHEKELEHTLTPDIEGDGFLLFRALLFGFRTAPLLWSRVAAWTSTLLQSCLPAEEAKHQTYLDDSLWALQGTLARRNLVLGFILHTMAALGFKLSVTKGERGASVTWAPGGPEDSDGQAVLAFRGSTQNQVDPEGLLCRHGGQGRRDPPRERGVKEGGASRPQEQERPLRCQKARRGQASTPPVPQRDEGSTIKKSFTDGPQHGKGVHHHGRLTRGTGRGTGDQ